MRSGGAYSAPPHVIGLCKLRKTKLDDIFFLFFACWCDDFSQQLNKLRWSNKSHLHWVYGGLAVSRGTLFYAASRLAMCFTWNVGRGGWVVGGWFLRTVFLPLLPRSWCFTWNRRIVGSSFWLLEECGSTSLSVIMRDCFLVIRFLWVYLLGVRVSLGGFHRRGFVLWLEWWGYWVGCRVSRETFCWIIGGLVELIQICLWEWLKLIQLLGKSIYINKRKIRI